MPVRQLRAEAAVAEQTDAKEALHTMEQGRQEQPGATIVLLERLRLRFLPLKECRLCSHGHRRQCRGLA